MWIHDSIYLLLFVNLKRKVQLYTVKYFFHLLILNISILI